MALDGKSILRSLQNNKTPQLDLFVRESVQNSLDAGRKKKPVKIRFDCGEFDSARISRHFERISRQLATRYPGKQRYISVRDIGTEGLSGPIRHQDISEDGNRGNLRKLIYEIGKAQDMEGAGGSWGLGKTMYYRMGIGLVIYYSRFLNENTGQYESRLAAAMVEDPSDAEQSMLPAFRDGAPPRGIAWWGAQDPEYPESTIPITDEEEIADILDGFDIACYRGEETGTTIVIPYIDDTKLLSEVREKTDASAPNESYAGPWWETSVDRYLNIAVQRWYAPRINNAADFEGRALQVWINNVPIRRDSMEPTFRLIAALYHAARTPNETRFFSDKPIRIKEITLRNGAFREGQRAGWVSYIRVTRGDLHMTPPDGKLDPFTYIGVSGGDSLNTPIVLYTRRPGMVVSYETVGDWIPTVQSLGAEEYIIGFFVPASNTLKTCGMSLEEYLRGCENADHMSWNDHRLPDGTPQTIVARIRSQVRKKIKDEFDHAEPERVVGTDLGLSKLLADAFMPPTGFGYWDAARGGSAGPGGVGGNGRKIKKEKPSAADRGRRAANGISMEITGNTRWSDGEAEIPVRITFRSRNAALIRISILTEQDIMGANRWEQQTEAPSPVEITGFRVDKVYADESGMKRRQKAPHPSPVPGEEVLPDDVEIDFFRTTRFDVPYGVRLTLPARTRASRVKQALIVDGALFYDADGVAGTISASGVEIDAAES